jgi:hypothetical protein
MWDFAKTINDPYLIKGMNGWTETYNLPTELFSIPLIFKDDFLINFASPYLHEHTK